MSIGTSDITGPMRDRGRGDPPSALADVFVNPLTRVLQYLDTKVQFARTEQIVDLIVASLEDTEVLDNFSLQLKEDDDSIVTRLSGALDDLASNFGMTRRVATSSQGVILLLRDSALTLPITITAGTKFFAPTLDQEYSAIETVIVSTMTFNAELNKFTAAIPITSVNTGVSTIASANQISQARDNITNIDGVTNTDPVVGGRDEENNRSLADRIKSALSQNNIGTKSGYRQLVLGLEDIRDVSIVGSGDPLMVRDFGDGGSVDIIITDPIPIQVSETAIAGINFTTSPPWLFSPSRQPLIDDVNSINPTAVAVNKDPNAFGGSINALDTIEFSSNVNGQTITYFANDNVNRTQEFLNDDSRQILGSDVLVKEAITVPVNIQFSITVLSGFSKSVVAGNVQTAINQFVTNLGIGDSLEQSDAIRIAADVPGVDRINLPMIRFDRGITGQLNVIEAASNEVLRIGTLIVSI